MSKGKGPIERRRPDVETLIRSLGGEPGGVSTGQVVAATGLSRQAVHYHFIRMVRAGEMQRKGAGRGTRYIRTVDLERVYALDGLREDLVWRELVDLVPALSGAKPNVRSILAHAFTEMLNNAVDHSRGATVRVAVRTSSDSIAFEVVDDGIGVFRNVRSKFGLRDDFAAIQEIAKGKATTAPERHSGEGIFFTSKMVDRFELESGRLRWIVDNIRDDQAVGDIPTRAGTRVGCAISVQSSRTTNEVFEAYAGTGSLSFSASSVLVGLFGTGGEFVSRSEAKRLGHRLERFEEVRLDFRDVSQVGQGFVDELFRVWASDHPQTRLIPINMSPAVERMVTRLLGEAPGSA
jgi:anti-sigma regulatory factor (Ser/Thr protein kinase)